MYIDLNGPPLVPFAEQIARKSQEAYEATPAGRLALAIGSEWMREQIPALFGVTFAAGAWQCGHVNLSEQKTHVLLVTLNKQGRPQEHKYTDYFLEGSRFHWQSQNSTTPDNKRGRELIDHVALGITVALFVRVNKLRNGKAAPFKCYGSAKYIRHEGTKPVSFIWDISEATQ